MFVGVTTFGADDAQSGLGRSARSLMHAMAQVADLADRFEVMVHDAGGRGFVPEHPQWRALRTPSFAKPDLRNIAWHHLVLPAFCRERRYDVLLLLAANRRVPLRALMRMVGAAPMVGVVPDLAALHVRGKYGFLRDGYVLRVLPFLLWGLDHVLTTSDFSRRDIVDFAHVPPERVTVTPLAVDQQHFRAENVEHSRETVARELGISEPYLLYTSRMEHPGKNHTRLIRAFARMKQRLGCPHRLVLAGRDWPGSAPIRAEVAKAGESAVVMVGFVPEDLLPHLYNGAEGFVFPSLCEGFGLPVLEARACETPVACSNSSSLPEVAGDAALLFDPMDEDAIERAMEELLFNEETRARLRTGGLQRAGMFSWERTARQTLDVLTQVSSSKNRNVRSG